MKWNYGKQRWVVCIPASQNLDGKRRSEYFKSKTQAEKRQLEVNSIKEKNHPQTLKLEEPRLWKSKDSGAATVNWAWLLANAYKRKWSSQKDGDSTRMKAETVIRFLCSVDLNPSNYTYSALEEFFDQLTKSRDVCDSTAQKYLWAFSGMITLAKERGDDIALSKANTPKLHKDIHKRVYWYNKNECDEIFNEFSKVASDDSPSARQSKIYLELLLETGCRTSEMLKISKKDLRMNACTLYIPPEHEKTGYGRIVPLTPRAMELFKLHLKNFEHSNVNKVCTRGVPLFPALSYQVLARYWRRMKKAMIARGRPRPYHVLIPSYLCMPTCPK